MLRYVRLVWLLPLFLLLLSCSGNSIVKDNSAQQGSGVKAGEEGKAQNQFLFILGPKDEIAINVWRNDDLKRSIQIDPSGNIQYPLVGEIKASGLTITQLREKLTLQLAKYIVNPQVDIAVTSVKTLKFHVLGEVKSPGTFEWRNGMLVWEAISQAGGFSQDANEDNILLVRSENGKAAIRAINLGSMTKGRNMNQDVYLRNGDVVYVIPTVIADVQRFMGRLGSIIAPFISLESGIIMYPQARDVLKGKDVTGATVVPVQ